MIRIKHSYLYQSSTELHKEQNSANCIQYSIQNLPLSSGSFDFFGLNYSQEPRMSGEKEDTKNLVLLIEGRDSYGAVCSLNGGIHFYVELSFKPDSDDVLAGNVAEVSTV